MSSVKLNEAGLERRLYHVEPTQQGIQALSMWIMTHKGHHERIVNLWKKIIKKSQPKHRLTLFYVANDVVQYAKRKKLNDLYESLRSGISDIIGFLRDDGILNNVQRVLEVWGEREVFEDDYIQDLRDSLDKQKLQAAQNAKIVERFKPSEMTDKIKDIMKRQSENENKLKQLKLVKVDVSSPEAIQQIKDRMHGTKHCNDFEDACSKLEDYVKSLAEQITLQKDVQDRLAQSEIYYEHQYGEAKIVANAYKNFSIRVNNLRKRLTEFIKVLPDPTEPEPVPLSPEYDAPSPGNTPPPDLTKDHIMDEHMDLSDGEGQEPSLVFEAEKSSPLEKIKTTEIASDGEESNSSFDVDALLEKELENSPQATPSQRKKKKKSSEDTENDSTRRSSPPVVPRPQHPAVASFLNTSYKTDTRSSSANSSPGRGGVDGGRQGPSALDKRLAALTAKGGETMMSLFGGLSEGREDDGCSVGSGDERGRRSAEGSDNETASSKAVKRPHDSSRDSPSRETLEDGEESEEPSQKQHRSSPSFNGTPTNPSGRPVEIPGLGSLNEDDRKPLNTTRNNDNGTPSTDPFSPNVRVPFIGANVPPGAPVPPTPPPSIAMFNSRLTTPVRVPASGIANTPPPRQPKPPIAFQSLDDPNIPPLPPPPPLPAFLSLNTPTISQQQALPTAQGTPAPTPMPQIPVAPKIPPSSQAASNLTAPHLSTSLAPSLLSPQTVPPPMANAGLVAITPLAVPTETKYDKSDEVLFKAQDDFLRRLKEKSVKAPKNDPSPMVNVISGISLPPKPTKSPPLSLAADKDSETGGDIDMRDTDVDPRSSGKDVDFRRKDNIRDRTPTKGSTPTNDSKSEGNNAGPTSDVDMRSTEKSEAAKSETKKKKRLSIVRPPPGASRSHESSSSSERRHHSTSSDKEAGEHRTSKEDVFSDSTRSHKESNEGGTSRSSAGTKNPEEEKRSVWRRLSASTVESSKLRGGRGGEDGDRVDATRRYSEICDNYYRSYYEEHYSQGHHRDGGGTRGGGSSGSRRYHDERYDERNYDRYEDDHRSGSKRRHR